MDVQQVLEELSTHGDENNKKILIKHGAKEPFYGVKGADLKKIQNKIKKDHELSLSLYDTGISDAMYLAGLIADETIITKSDLKKWIKGAYWYWLSEYAVAWIAAESRFGFELALEWIESDEEKIASSGWATLSSVMSITPDEDFDQKKIEQLMDRVVKDIHKSQNRIRYTMNGFIIAAGSFMQNLTGKAKYCAGKIGKVEVEMGDTACKVPLATEYIAKVESKGRIGKRKKVARC